MVTGIQRLTVAGACAAVALSVTAAAGAWPDLSAGDPGGTAGTVQPGMQRQQSRSGDSPLAQLRARPDGRRSEVSLEPIVSGSRSGGVDVTTFGLLAGVCAACAAIGGAVAVRARHRVAHA